MGLLRGGGGILTSVGVASVADEPSGMEGLAPPLEWHSDTDTLRSQRLECGEASLTRRESWKRDNACQLSALTLSARWDVFFFFFCSSFL